MEFTSYASSSRGNLYRVTHGGESLLLECGLPLKKIRQALGYGLTSVSGCLLTHEHEDHSRGAAAIMKAGVDLYCSGRTALEALDLRGHRLHLVEPLKQYSIGRFQILPFEVEHDCPGALGFLIQADQDKLLFAVDTHYVHYRFEGLTHICVECNHSAETMSPETIPAEAVRLSHSHFSLERVLEFLAANDLSQCREINLLHLSDRNSDAAYFRSMVRQAAGIPVYVAEA